MIRVFTLEGFGLWDPTREAYGDLVIRFSVEYVQLDDAKMRLLTETFLPPDDNPEEEDWITLQV
jgi:hypothetical protein